MPNCSRSIDATRCCHRHWVVGPLFLLGVVLSSSSSLSFSKTPAEVSSREGEEVLFQDEGMITVKLRDFAFYGMHGAFTMVEHSGHVTVASLTTPVLVRGVVDTWTVVPVGFQWRSDGERVLLPLPAAFQYAKLQELQNAPFASPSARWDLSVVLPAALRLPVAEERREDMLRMQQLSTLVREVARGQSVAPLVQSDAMIAALSSEEGYHMLPSILAELQDAPYDRSLLFPFLFQKEEGALLALFHPAFRDHAALLDLDELSPGARMAYLLSLPRSDLLPHALSTLAFSRWEEHLAQELSERPDALPLFTTLLATIEDVGREYARRRYMEREQRTIAAMQHFSTLLQLMPALQERLDALPRLSRVSDQMTPLVAVSSSSASASSSSVDPAVLEDLRKRVVGDLTADGGMFIPQTIIEAVSPTAVQVSSLVFATSKGDELFDFIYDTARQEVSDVLRGSTRYPYAVPLSQFVEWVRN